MNRQAAYVFFFLMMRRPPISTLFPYTTLFRSLLVPTVNLAAYPGLLPAFGVYVTRLTVGERCFLAVTNVGNRPTAGEASLAVESHILDFEPVDLSEATTLELEFLLRLRPEMTWSSPEALKAQIFKDVSKAKRFFALTAKSQ